jgi:hypothetical protein
MDKLAGQLKSDAGQIEVHISNELERRIDASLQGVSPERRATSAPERRRAGFWWASSLTGAIVALLVLGLVNFYSRPAVVQDSATATTPVAELMDTPIIEWKTRSAMLTSPLRQELEDLQSDVERAEKIVRASLGL